MNKIIGFFISTLLSVSTVTANSQSLQNDNGWRPAWGLDRIDQRETALNDLYNYVNDGTGVSVYVFDSGINSLHEEYAGRIDSGFTAINDGFGTEDCSGHGSHTASIIGGKTYGVAKNVKLIPVRVLNCNNANPSSASLYPAIEWIIQHHSNGVPAVVNISVGMPKSAAFNDAMTRLIADGLIVVAAAGNQGKDACNYSPASATSVISVGAIDRNDSRPSYSNFGSCVDIFAPGSDMVAAWSKDKTSYRSTSGTSNAAPLVTGVIATILQSNPLLTQQDVAQILISNATNGVILNTGQNSPNLLLYSVFSQK